MFAVSAQNRARLSIVGHVARVLGTVIDGTRFRMESNAVVDLLPCEAFQLGKGPSQALRVLPNVRASAVTAVGALETVEAVIVEVIGCGGRHTTDRQESALEEPVR